MKKKLGRFLVNFLYGVLWLAPIYYFARDFFELSSFEILKESYIQEIISFSIKQGFYSTIMALIVGIVPAYYSAYNKDTLSKFIQGLVFILSCNIDSYNFFSYI